MEQLTQLTSKTTVLPIDDVDTDQIIPARFLTTTTRDGIGKALFADWRFDAQGNAIKDFPLNAPDIADCKFLVAGRNFGCGSSREHAPWSLFDFGIRAVISSEIADIDTHQWLLANPGAEVTVDLEARELRLPTGKAVTFPIDNFARHCILEGIDQTGYLMQNIDNIGRFESNRSWQP
jgi:3-isopropylmalate/(R)-2-methylmalate dehydratase small subunit